MDNLYLRRRILCPSPPPFTTVLAVVAQIFQTNLEVEAPLALASITASSRRCGASGNELKRFRDKIEGSVHEISQLWHLSLVLLIGRYIHEIS
jgi:hypothetical protein